jgi:hypothetical protein
VDDLNSKLATLERERNVLRRDIEQHSGEDSKMAELELVRWWRCILMLEVQWQIKLARKGFLNTTWHCFAFKRDIMPFKAAMLADLMVLIGRPTILVGSTILVKWVKLPSNLITQVLYSNSWTSEAKDEARRWQLQKSMKEWFQSKMFFQDPKRT